MTTLLWILLLVGITAAHLWALDREFKRGHKRGYCQGWDNGYSFGERAGRSKAWNEYSQRVLNR